LLVARRKDFSPEYGMKIGILGAGNIGATAARLFVAAGHDVAVSNSRGPDSLRDLIVELGPQANAMNIRDAARFGEVILLAVPWRSPEALPEPELLRNKIVIDAMNPYRPDGGFYDLGGSTSSEEVLKRMPGSRLVITSILPSAVAKICLWMSAIPFTLPAMMQKPKRSSRG
jgi:predicted dinucleotide-binding enzyme